MPDSPLTSQSAALQVIQQAVRAIIDWATKQSNATTQQPAALQLVFDRIQLPDGQGQPNQPNYRPATILEVHQDEKTPRIPYARGDRPEDFTQLKAEIGKAAKHLDWENLSQLMMFLKPMAPISVGENRMPILPSLTRQNQTRQLRQH